PARMGKTEDQGNRRLGTADMLHAEVAVIVFDLWESNPQIDHHYAILQQRGYLSYARMLERVYLSEN
ncbi:MAG: hypothetical protein AAF514_24070, partial [Verrucomicrobiota bacterium]